ncbi:hypothetical protein [Spongiactinospora sp. TRM90649]|uniref:hypothetical protein n=1 Tax=Spongiactinospora sp. TRM90649 TaxID=3031114 RepID=UPI0023F6F335|nr:hypothetical protein [Spongiactinospora sp. TRM90649]MDF5754236.1 hypothetical protein [Spongiactinospora sp. TRM90649]
MENEAKILVADLLSQIITDIKQSRPTKTDGVATQGFVYSQMVPGQMISPRDFAGAWVPTGQSTGTTAPAAPGQPITPPNEVVGRAMMAAANTATLMDRMMVVTDNGTLSTFPGGGRQVSLTFGQILQAMEAEQPPPRPADVEAKIAEAKAVLWTADLEETPAYARYLKNQKAYAKAISNFVVNQNITLADPVKAPSWPIIAREFQDEVDQAFDRWKTQDADKIEAALATVQSLGVPLEQGMIAAARKRFDAWSLNFEGVPVKTPFTRVLPSEWALPSVDDIGWTIIDKDRTSYSNYFTAHGDSLSTGEWRGQSSSTSGSAGIGVFGFGFSGSHAESDSSAGSAFSTTAHDGTSMTSDATDLSIHLEYGLCQIVRPWLTTDLFHMQNWFLRASAANSISDGSITGQVGKDSAAPFLPMIPTHFLAIRNVRIHSSQWGSVQNTLNDYWTRNASQSSASSSSTSGGVSIPVLGPFSLSGGVAHSESESQGSFTDEAGNNHSSSYGARFDGETLEIRGTQVVAWLSEVLPACPPKPDPSMPQG